MISNIVEFKKFRDRKGGEAPESKPRAGSLLLEVHRQSTEERLAQLVVHGLMVIHWVDPLFGDNFADGVELNYASLGYVQDDKIIVCREFLDALIPHSDNRPGAHWYTVRRPFYNILNAGLKEIGFTGVTYGQSVDIKTEQPLYARFHREEVLRQKSAFDGQ